MNTKLLEVVTPPSIYQIWMRQLQQRFSYDTVPLQYPHLLTPQISTTSGGAKYINL